MYDQKDYEENYLQIEEGMEEEEEGEFDIDLDAQIDEAFEAEIGDALEEALGEDEEELELEEDILDQVEASENEEEEESSDEEGEEELSENEELEQDENSAVRAQMNTITEEIKELDAKIAEKKSQAEKQVNMIMKSRFENIVSTLRNEMGIKKKQLEILKQNLFVPVASVGTAARVSSVGVPLAEEDDDDDEEELMDED